MAEHYVEKIDDTYRIAGSRVSLDSVVQAYWNGLPAEEIAQSFPGLSREKVHGALAYYLAHQAEIDAYMAEGEAQYEALRESSRRQTPEFYEKLASARQAGKPA
jgi:uncharacterized protein (DUF433 family)